MPTDQSLVPVKVSDAAGYGILKRMQGVSGLVPALAGGLVKTTTLLSQQSFMVLAGVTGGLVALVAMRFGGIAFPAFADGVLQTAATVLGVSAGLIAAKGPRQITIERGIKTDLAIERAQLTERLEWAQQIAAVVSSTPGLPPDVKKSLWDGWRSGQRKQNLLLAGPAANPALAPAPVDSDGPAVANDQQSASREASPGGTG